MLRFPRRLRLRGTVHFVNVRRAATIRTVLNYFLQKDIEEYGVTAKSPEAVPEKRAA